MNGPFRDSEQARAQRVAELTRAIGTAESALAALDLEIGELSTTQQRRLSPKKAPISKGPHAAGVIVGVVFGFPPVCMLGLALLFALFD